MDITDIIARPLTPLDWDNWRKIPWNDAAFSARMLRNHLSQEHDWASRTNAIIERQVAVLDATLPRNASVLDLGCGPGLYTEKLAALGHSCTGVDFSPASIEYAKKQPHAGQVTYVLEDIRTFRPSAKYDAVLLLFGEINVFAPDEALQILANAADSLTKGGTLFLEAHTEQAIRQIGALSPIWQAMPEGLFSDKPHLQLEEHLWNEERLASMSRYYIVDAENARCEEYASLMQAYTDAQYEALLRQAGLSVIRQLSTEDWPVGAPFDGKLRCFGCSV